MELQGYCMIKDTADFTKAMGESKDWVGKPIRCLEINESTGAVLAIDGSGTQMGSFDFEDLQSHFRCQTQGDVLMPSNLKGPECFLYFTAVMSRNGGYNELLRNMVIMSSLHKRKFNDHVLWTKGQDPQILELVNTLSQK